MLLSFQWHRLRSWSSRMCVYIYINIYIYPIYIFIYVFIYND